MTPNPPEHFEEHYIVNIDFQKPDGLWVHNFEVDVLVTCQHGVQPRQSGNQSARSLPKLPD